MIKTREKLYKTEHTTYENYIKMLVIKQPGYLFICNDMRKREKEKKRKGNKIKRRIGVHNATRCLIY